MSRYFGVAVVLISLYVVDKYRYDLDLTESDCRLCVFVSGRSEWRTRRHRLPLVRSALPTVPTRRSHSALPPPSPPPPRRSPRWPPTAGTTRRSHGCTATCRTPSIGDATAASKRTCTATHARYALRAISRYVDDNCTL